MAELFKDFTNLYPVSKTLRFELIPEGETLYYLEKNGVLENDEKRNEDYKKLKKLMDEYYRAYIDEALSNVHLSDFSFGSTKNFYCCRLSSVISYRKDDNTIEQSELTI